MPIDPSIALGLKPFQVESPINQMAKAYEMQNAIQANKLNQMKMDEYSRGLAEEEAFKNALGSATDEAGIKNAFYSMGSKGVKAYNDYTKAKAEQEKLAAETKNLGYTGQKTQGEVLKAKQDFLKAALRDISSNPSDENIIAWGQDAINNGHMDLAEAKAQVGRMLAIPQNQRQAFLASQGATAADLKPHIQTQNLGGTSQIVAVPAFGGAPSVLSTSKMTATPGELLTASTTRRGQDLTNARELQRIEIEKGKNAPEAIALRAKMEEQGKAQAKFEAAAPSAIKSAEDAIANIDAMVGKAPELDKTGKIVKKGTAPHPGFSGAVGMGGIETLGIPGIAQYTPGSAAASFKARYDQLKGKAFLDAYDTLRGGGAITEIEGAKAEKARMRMDLAQSEDEFITAAREFQSELRDMVRKNKARLGTGGAGNAIPRTSEAPKGVDQNVWDHMTPEEQKLFH